MEEGAKKKEITADYVKVMAFGEMGMQPKDFYDLTWGEWKCKQYGWMRNIERQWLHTRSMLSIHAKKHVKPKDIIELSFDREQFTIDEEESRKLHEWAMKAKKAWGIN